MSRFAQTVAPSTREQRRFSPLTDGQGGAALDDPTAITDDKSIARPAPSQDNNAPSQIRDVTAKERPEGHILADGVNVSDVNNPKAPTSVHDDRQPLPQNQDQDALRKMQQTLTDYSTRTADLAKKSAMTPQEAGTAPSKLRRFGGIAAGAGMGFLSMNPLVGMAAYKGVTGAPERERQGRIASEQEGLAKAIDPLKTGVQAGNTIEQYAELPIKQAAIDVQNANLNAPEIHFGKNPQGQEVVSRFQKRTGNPVGAPEVIPGTGTFMAPVTPDMKETNPALPAEVPPDMYGHLVAQTKPGATTNDDKLLNTAAKVTANKYGVVLDPKKPAYEQLDAINPEYAKEAAQTQASMKTDPTLNESRRAQMDARDQYLEMRAQDLARRQEDFEKKWGAKGAQMYENALGADDRLAIMMQDAKEDNGQSDTSLLFNHIGMTLGLQKGARITEAEINSARNARSLPEGIYAAYIHRPATGAFLSPKQRQDMIDLAVEMRNRQWSTAREKARLTGIREEPTQDPSLPPVKDPRGGGNERRFGNSDTNQEQQSNIRVQSRVQGDKEEFQWSDDDGKTWKPGKPPTQDQKKTSEVIPPSGNLPQRNNNPLNIKLGGLTKKYVDAGKASEADAGSDGGKFLKFNSSEDGFDAAYDLLTSDLYKNLSLDEALKKWSNNGYGAKEIASHLAGKKINQMNKPELYMVLGNMAKREGYYAADGN